jgi:hypothetical protein
MAAASNNGRSPASSFPKYLRPQLPTSHFSHLASATLNWLNKRSTSKLCYERWSVGHSVLVSDLHLGATVRECGFVDVGCPIWQEGESVIYNCCWSFTVQSFSGPSHAELNHISLSQGRGSPKLVGQVPVFISPRNRVSRLYLPGTGFPFRRLLRLAGIRWRYSNPPPRRVVELSKSKTKLCTLQLTVGQSVSLGVEPHMGLMTRYLLLFASYDLVFVRRPLWREDGSVFSICCWPSPGSLSRVRVPWDSWPYFTVSDLRLSFSSPPTTRRVTVEVFDPASTRVGGGMSLSLSHIATDGQSVCLSWCRTPSGAHDQILVTVWQLLFCPWGVSLSLTKEWVCLL